MFFPPLYLSCYTVATLVSQCECQFYLLSPWIKYSTFYWLIIWLAWPHVPRFSLIYISLVYLEGHLSSSGFNMSYCEPYVYGKNCNYVCAHICSRVVYKIKFMSKPNFHEETVSIAILENNRWLNTFLKQHSLIHTQLCKCYNYIAMHTVTLLSLLCTYATVIFGIANIPFPCNGLESIFVLYKQTSKQKVQ